MAQQASLGTVMTMSMMIMMIMLIAGWLAGGRSCPALSLVVGGVVVIPTTGAGVLLLVRVVCVAAQQMFLKKYLIDPVLRIRIRSGAFLTPGSGMGKKTASGSGIRDEQPGSYFLELRNHFLGLKYLKVFDADPGWRQFGSGIRDPGWKKVGSGINIPNPQHWIDRYLRTASVAEPEP
jgi:hypothetical protein